MALAREARAQLAPPGVGVGALSTTPSTALAPRGVTPSLRARFGFAFWSAQLSASSVEARLGAARALARWPAYDRLDREELIERLSERLRVEADAQVQVALIDALTTLADDAVAPLLINVVTMRSALAPASARRALVALGPRLDREGIDALVRAIEQGALAHPDTRLAALDALAAAPDEALSDRVAAHRSAPQKLAILLEAIGRRGDGRWSSAVLEQVNTGQGPVLLGAIRAASDLRLLEAAPALARILQTDAAPIDAQLAAVRALAVVGAGDPDGCRAALRAALGREALATSARSTIARLGIRALTAEVARGLEASWLVDRREAAEALGDLGGEEAGRTLRAALEREADPLMRRILWRAALRADEASTRVALEAADARDEAARWAALELLAGRAVRLSMRSASAQAARGDPAAMALECAAGRCEAARSALSARALGARRAGAFAYCFSPSPDVSVLASALAREADEGARALLIMALARSPSTEATLVLEGRLSSGVEDGLTAEQVLLAELLSQRGSGVARGAISALLRDRRPLARAVGLWVALRAEDGLGLASARRLASEDASPEVRRAAQRVLAARRGEARARLVGGSTLHGAGLAPATLFGLWLPDGQVVLAVSASDGTLLVPHVPATSFEIEALL